jgi:hypothetical protein
MANHMKISAYKIKEGAYWLHKLLYVVLVQMLCFGSYFFLTIALGGKCFFFLGIAISVPALFFLDGGTMLVALVSFSVKLL